MNNYSFHTDVKNLIHKHFAFLVDYGFGEFTEKQLAYEYHYQCFNDSVNIDIWFEQIFASPIWLTINGLYATHIEPDNKILTQHSNQLKEIHTEITQKFPGNDTSTWIAMADKYSLRGKTLYDGFLKALSDVLKRHPKMLHGDVEQLKINNQIAQTKRKALEAAERIKNKIYTLEIDFWNNGELSAEIEFNDIEEIKYYLKHHPEIKNYRILDCYSTEIKI